MQFLNQILLAGLAAAAIPIIIHLLNRRRFKRVPWAAMRFVQVSLQRNQRRMQIEDLILLLLRTLLVALLALALARPAIDWLRANFLGSSTIATAIILDRSGSMAAADRFGLAKQAAAETVDTLPDGSAAAVLLTADSADSGIFEPTVDLRLVRTMIGEASLSDRPTDLLPAVEKALGILARGSAIEKELVLITDGQAEGWKQFEPLLKQLADAEGTRLKIVLVGAQDPITDNLGVSDLRQVSALTPVGQALRFEIAVTNYGDTEASSIAVSLDIDNSPSGDPFIIDQLPAGETKNVTLFAKLPTPGYHRVTAALPADPMPADDRRTIILRAADGIEVLLVDGQPGRDALGSETFFIGNALVPVPPELAGEFFIKTRTVTVADLSPDIFQNQTAVVLANVTDLGADTIEALTDYVRRGGGLLIFPGSNTNAANLSNALQNLLPATLGAQLDGPLSLQASGLDHSIAALWEDPGSGDLADATFARAFSLTLIEDTRTVLRFSDGNPALTERDLGLGKVFLFASTADTEWNNLPVRPAFLPLIHRLLGAIIARGESGLNIPAGTPFQHRLRPELAGKEAIITTAENQSSVQQLDAQATLRYDRTDRAGAYEVSIADPPTLLQFAAQPDPRESRLETLSPQQRERLAQHADLTDFTTTGGLGEVLSRGRSGAELWVVLIIAAIALAVLEMALAQWFSREK